MKAVGYVRVSTAEQAAGGLGVGAQRAAIRAACRSRRWDLVAIQEDLGVSGGPGYRRGLSRAVELCEANEGSMLVVAKLDRLARSVLDYVKLVDQARSDGWRLIALDTPETDTPQGEAMQAMTAVFAQLERRLISQRTREALAVLKANGVRLGRPPAMELQVRDQIAELYSQGYSAYAICRHLEAQGADAPHGGRRWHTSTVTRAVRKLHPRE